ncbi:hypothetical protein [Ornithinimicrobium sufpigmenti]|uniref:hypothetical protein n=1 Tax=Ornithinimicrobium sufpigmenti TaxID=2508882 RepID=UPI001035B9A0|nr:MULTISPECIES: hypothetical protein [unclassified Ornithinimicrobium]
MEVDLDGATTPLDLGPQACHPPHGKTYRPRPSASTTAEVLTELGLSDDEVDLLRIDGVV